MTKTEYERLRKQIQEHYETDLAALDRVYGLCGGEANVPYGAVTKAVRDAIYKQDGPFTTRSIESEIVKAHPELEAESCRTSITNVLMRLADSGDVQCTKRGVGRSPSVYAPAVATNVR